MRSFQVVSLAVVILFFRTSASAVIVTDGLIHLWHLDEANGTTARDSVGSWDLELLGGAVLGTPAVNGTGVRLDGRNDHLISAPVLLDFMASDFTLSLWVQWVSAPSKPGLLEFSDSEGLPRLAIDLGYPDIKPFLFYRGELRVSTSKSIADNQWHLLSAVREGHLAFVYIDTILVGSGAGDLTTTGTAGTFNLGQYGGTHLFSGTIDEVAIYNRALSPSEIAANVPEPGAAPLLLFSGGLVVTARRRKGLRLRRIG